MKITINESELKNIIRETINELSPQFLNQASDAAREKGRYKQANAFSDGADERAASGFSQRDDVNVKSKSISWLVNHKVRGVPTCSCVLSRNGHFACSEVSMGQHYNTCSGTISPEYPRFDERMKTDDKSLARMIAQWWKTYGDVENMPQLADWHTWCLL